MSKLGKMPGWRLIEPGLWSEPGLISGLIMESVLMDAQFPQ